MKSSIYALTIDLSAPTAEQSYIIAAAALILGIFITWLICSRSKKASIAKISAELEAEKNRTDDTKQRLATTQKDLQILRDSEAELKQNEASLLAKLTAEQKATKEKEHTLQATQANLTNMDKRFTAIEQLVKPVATAIEKVEQRTEQLEKARDAAHTSLSQQVQNIVTTQLGQQKETTQLVETLESLERSVKEALQNPPYIPRESEKQIEPIDGIIGDEDATDFSLDSLADEFEGFTAESEGEGI